MPMTFDATLKDMGRENSQGFLAVFDRPTELPIRLLNVDLAAVTRSADLVVGIGEPTKEIVHLESQSSASATKHVDLLVYNVLLFSQNSVPVHTIIVLLRPQADHPTLTGVLDYAPRPEDGSMVFRYKVIRLWEQPAEDLLAADLGVAPLAVLGCLPESTAPEDGLAMVVQRLVERVTREAMPDAAKKLLTEALLLAGLRVRREVALKVFRGVRMMQESDTYMMILEEGEEKAWREAIFTFGETRLGGCDEATRAELTNVTDLGRLKRMFQSALRASDWEDIFEVE